MGPVGPIGYPGPKGLKVRECLSSLSSHPSIAEGDSVPPLGSGDCPEREDGQQ